MKSGLTILFSLALSQHLTRGSTATKIPFDANFDDLTVIPDVSTLNNIGIYRNISFTNFQASQPGLANESISGVEPHSNPNHAVLANKPAGTLTVSYPGSKVKSFALTSFYYGCNEALVQGAISFAAPCNVTVTGYKAGAKKAAATETFVFKPAEAVDLQNEPTLGKLSGAFAGLQSVIFSYVPLKTAVLELDDIVGTLTT